MSRYLPVEELDNQSFQAFYECMKDCHGTLYADFVLGSPREIVIDDFPVTALKKSHRNCTCVQCGTGIRKRNQEDTLFEVAGAGEDMCFFLCEPCQAT